MPGRIAIVGSLLDLPGKSEYLAYEADLNRRIAESGIGECVRFFWTTRQDRYVLPSKAVGSLRERLSVTNRQQGFDAVVLLHDLDGRDQRTIRGLASQAGVPLSEPPVSLRVSRGLTDWLLDRLKAGMAGDVWCLGPHGIALVIVLCVMIKDKAWSSTGHGHGIFFTDSRTGSPKLSNDVCIHMNSLQIANSMSIIGDVITVIQGEKRANQEQLIVRGGTPRRYMLNSGKAREICGCIRNRDIRQLGAWITDWVARKDQAARQHNIFRSCQHEFAYPKLVDLLRTAVQSINERTNPTSA